MTLFWTTIPMEVRAMTMETNDPTVTETDEEPEEPAQPDEDEDDES